MPASSSEFVTLCYDDYPDQREFVFSIKGRPFSMLSSQKLSTPTTSLIDYNLVNDLQLKMTDLQCSKFTYGGQRFRILGKISQTVQTIKNGVISGTVHLKASVVEGLRNVFDSHSIAGKKFSELLSRKVSKTSPPASPRTTPPRSTRSPETPSTRQTPPKVKSSPPGFPAVPQYSGNVSTSIPTTPRNQAPPGRVRKLQLRPRDDQDKTWHQGRVLKIAPTGYAWVKVIRGDDDPYREFHGESFNQYARFPGLKVEPNDAVLYHSVDMRTGLEYLDAQPRIYVVYNEEEVDTLKKYYGVEFPDMFEYYD